VTVVVSKGTVIKLRSVMMAESYGCNVEECDGTVSTVADGLDEAVLGVHIKASATHLSCVRE
jgi:hypothetical protein